MDEARRHYYLQQMGIKLWRHYDRSIVMDGNANARLMVIGDPPFFEEDTTGVLYVGQIERLFRFMLKSIGLSIEDVYIANLMKCSTSDDSVVDSFEINQCSDYLAQQIAIIRPKVILAVGPLVERFLLKESPSHYQDIPVLVSYHPRQLLQHPINKKKAYEDLLSIQRFF